jgi:hypothetical protein
LPVGQTGPKEKAYFVKFFYPVNFVVLNRLAYGTGSGSQTPGNGSRILENDTDLVPGK